jgi:hypothetical protein
MLIPGRPNGGAFVRLGRLGTKLELVLGRPSGGVPVDTYSPQVGWLAELVLISGWLARGAHIHLG